MPIRVVREFVRLMTSLLWTASASRSVTWVSTPRLKTSATRVISHVSSLWALPMCRGPFFWYPMRPSSSYQALKLTTQ